MSRSARRREPCWRRCRRWINERSLIAACDEDCAEKSDEERTQLNHAMKLAGVAVVLVALASPALCQEARLYRDGASWVQEMTGNLGAAKNLRIKLAAGSARVQGGSQGVTYVIHRRAS